MEERRIEPATIGLQDQHADHGATAAPNVGLSTGRGHANDNSIFRPEYL